MNCPSGREATSFDIGGFSEPLFEVGAAAGSGNGSTTSDPNYPNNTGFKLPVVSLAPYPQVEQRHLDVVQLSGRPPVSSDTQQELQHAPTGRSDKIAKVQEFTCSICRQSHSKKKSLRRHLRSVHQPKRFNCARCSSSFTRNDTLARHIAEQHGGSGARIRCISCGKHISERAFAEHLDSRACKDARTLVARERFDGLEFGFPGQDDDAFLVTVRMFMRLKLSLSFATGTQEPQLTSGLFSRDGNGQLSTSMRHSHDVSRWNQLYGRALYLTRQQFERDISALYIFAALWCSAVLLGLMSFARGLDEDAWVHFKGAEAALTIRHRSTCDCRSYESCKQWRRPTIRDPTLALLGRILEERGFTKSRAPLLHVKMTEDDALRFMCLHHFMMLDLFSNT